MAESRNLVSVKTGERPTARNCCRTWETLLFTLAEGPTGAVEALRTDNRTVAEARRAASDRRRRERREVPSSGHLVYAQRGLVRLTI